MITITFAVEKETKNTVKFQEVPVKGQADYVGQLYVQKHTIEALDNPTTITVTIDAA
jgi:hypothetical protein